MLHQSTGAVDVVGNCGRIAAVQCQRAVIDDSTCTQRTCGATCAYLQSAAVDGRCALVAVVTSQCGGACALLHQRTRAADVIGDRGCVTAVQSQRTVIGHSACAQRTRGST